jgi:Terminase small subunit
MPNVRDYLADLCARAQDQVVVTAGRVPQEEACLAFYDIGDLVDPNTGEIQPPHELPEPFRQAVVGVTIVETRSATNPDLIKTEYRYRFADKGKALERLSRHLGLYEKDNRQKPPEEVRNSFVLLPTQRELTLAEWEEQVKEYNRLQAEAKQVESGQKMLN